MEIFNCFRTWLFSKYFKDVENIFDFGAGTACHLELISRDFPKKNCMGLIGLHIQKK